MITFLSLGFSFLSAGFTFLCVPQANVEQFNKVVEGFKSLGFRDDELDSVYRILAAVINLGDVEFYQTIDKDNMEQAAVRNVEQIKVGECW